MKKERTHRNFNIYNFKDRNNTECSLQKSSVATENCIWLGANNIGLKHFTKDRGWENINLINTIEEHYVANNRIYVGSNDEYVYCLDAETGGYIWDYKTNGGVLSSPAIADNKVFVGSYDDNIYCLDATTGKLIWNHPTGGYVRSSPAVCKGKVFVGSYDGIIYCFGNNDDNQPPTKPEIDGPTFGKTGKEYKYYFTSIDPDNDNIIEYIINWGDGNVEIISGPFSSGTPIKVNHTWTDLGSYCIKSKAIDIYGAESNWGELNVYIPRTRSIKNSFYLRFPFFLSVIIKLILK